MDTIDTTYLNIGQVVILVNHNLLPLQIASSSVLKEALDAALLCDVELIDDTVKGRCLSELEILKRLNIGDVVEYKCDTTVKMLVCVTIKALLLEFVNPEFFWTHVLFDSKKLTMLKEICDRLCEQFKSKIALVVPSSNKLRSSMAQEFFYEAITVDEIALRLGTKIGLPFQSYDEAHDVIQKASDTLELPVELSNGYFIWG